MDGLSQLRCLRAHLPGQRLRSGFRVKVMRQSLPYPRIRWIANKPDGIGTAGAEPPRGHLQRWEHAGRETPAAHQRVGRRLDHRA